MEVGRLVDNSNTTLNLLVSVNGINDFNFVDGASNTDTFVNFFFKAQIAFLKMDFQLQSLETW